MSRAFTLIELLVVIAIIAVLSVVVILTLNPAQLLTQARDANRVSDVSTLNSAISLYLTQGGMALGSGSTTYISIPDPIASTTAGDHCDGLGLPALPSGDFYHCAASSTYRNTDGTGWVPVNFTGIATGAPLSQLPIDPINQTSSNLFYTYTTNGTQYQVTAIPESSKYKTQYGSSFPVADYPDIMSQGSNLTLSELWSTQGLVGYWPMEEGIGSSTADKSGNGNIGVWQGASVGSNGYYVPGKIGNWAGAFNSAGTYIITPSNNFPTGSAARSEFAWIQFSNCNGAVFGTGKAAIAQSASLYTCSSSGSPANHYYFEAYSDDVHTSVLVPSFSTWHFVGYTYTAGAAGVTLYLDGNADAENFQDYSEALNTQFGSSTIGADINGTGGINGYIDDVRMYNRTLSAAEVQALYNAEK